MSRGVHGHTFIGKCILVLNSNGFRLRHPDVPPNQRITNPRHLFLFHMPFEPLGISKVYEQEVDLNPFGGIPRGLREALGDVSFEGASGTIGFDEKGDVEGVYEVYLVQNSAFVKQ